MAGDGTIAGVHVTLPAPYYHLGDVIPAGDNRAFLVTANQPSGSVVLRVEKGRAPRVVAQAWAIFSAVAGGEADEVIALTSIAQSWWLVRLRGSTVVASHNLGTGPLRRLGFNPARGYTVMRTAVGYSAIDPATGAMHPIASRPAPWGTGNYFCYDPTGGSGEYVEFIRENYRAPASLAWFDDATGAMRKVAFGSINAASAVARASDRAWPVRYRIIGYESYNPALLSLDANGTVLTSVQVALTDIITGSPLVRLSGDPLNVRVVTPPNDRALELAFPYDGGRAYAVGLSLRGAAALTSLPDGRPLPIVPDAFTVATLNDRLAPLVTGATGLLDASGRATVPIRANALGAAVRGRTIWATAIVLDPAAPSGVAHVTDPVRVELR